MANTYKEILDSYAKRLISTNSRTRTIYYSKDDKAIMDVSRLVSIVGYDNFCSFLKNEVNELKLSYGACSTSKIFSLFDKYIDGEIGEKEILDEYYSFTKKDFDLLKNEKKGVYTELYNKYELLKKKELKNLMKINDENESRIKTSGKDDLYIGFPYIQGQFNRDKVVRAPLVLHKITVRETGENVYVSHVGTRLLNPVFVMSYLVENDLKYKDHLDFEIIENDYMEIVYKILKNIGIKYDNKLEDGLSKMVYLTKKDFKGKYKYQDNKFEILNHCSFGIFPISDKKIYDDVVELRDNEEINEMLNAFYDKNSEVNVFNDEEIDVDENKLKYITVLDYSQKKTLQDSLTKNCIIQGPPGTGKSQVIVNIAANFLLNREKVLFCSEKRTATDVIYNRLGKLSSFALLLHDHVSEKNHFYDSIAKAINSIKENIEKYKYKAFNFNENYKIENFFSDSKKYDEIINKDYNGLSFKEMMEYKDRSFIYEKEFDLIDKCVSNSEALMEKIYKYEGSDEYKIAKKWEKELKKEYYLKYKIKISNKKLLLLKDLISDISKLNNNYLKNIKIDNFINNSSNSVSLLKKIFSKKEELKDISKDFLNNEMHDFNVFYDKPFSNELEECLFLLKFRDNLNDEEIVENYKIYISKKLVRDIDFSFMESYTINYEQNMKETFECMDKKRDESIEFIARSCSADIKEILSSSVYNDLLQKLLGEVNKKRKPPIKVVVEKYFEVLRVLFPIWIMTPEVVSGIIPLKEEIFDKVIFDEASQLFIERTVPAISRGKSVIICGDSKQLRPTLFFESRYDESDEDVEVEVEQESALTETSLLDYATTSNKYVSNMLSYHYRCHYKELINFSNYAFYEGKLTFATNSKGKELLPIETINVNGKWDGEKNIIEAKRVVELIKNLLINRKEKETIGVVTLNVNQRDLILDLLDDEAIKDKEFGVLYNLEKIRKDEESNEDESVFVKNLESVQGDERDIIIFSISYSKDEKGKIGSSLGEIQRQYGENRLNVAISRAKKKIYVVKSFMGNDLNVNEDNKGPAYFKKYLQYVDCLNNDNKDGAFSILNSLVLKNDGINVDYRFESIIDELSRDLLSSVDNSVYNVKKYVNVGSFTIDLVVYKNDEYLLGIDLSGVNYHSNDNQVSNEIYKHYYLKNRGWNIYKLWLSDWLIDKEQQINNILNELDNSRI